MEENILMPKKKAKRLVDVLDGIDKMEVQYTKVIPKLHKLMNIIRSSVISERREYDYSFVEGMVKDIEQNKCVISKLDLDKCNVLYRKYK
tara:strand:- start:1121 stop:1390 length:270 start_codon:yes stop_codon:yes gene_type:complete